MTMSHNCDFISCKYDCKLPIFLINDCLFLVSATLYLTIGGSYIIHVTIYCDYSFIYHTIVTFHMYDYFSKLQLDMSNFGVYISQCDFLSSNYDYQNYKCLIILILFLETTTLHVTNATLYLAIMTIFHNCNMISHKWDFIYCNMWLNISQLCLCQKSHKCHYFL